MTHVELIKEIQAKKIAPVYLLHGEESYYIDRLSEFIEDTVLTPEQKDFNLHVFYGKDADAQTIIDACRRYPMFAEKSVVILKEAQMMKAKGNEIDKLELYTAAPSPFTVLVICYKEGKLDARKKFFKTIKDQGIIYESEALREQDIPNFIDNYLRKRNFTIEPKANNLLLEYLGTDLNKIANELNKLIINLKPGEKVTVKEIEENIGISKDYNIWELQSALLVKNTARVFTILHYLNQNPKTNPFVLTISNLHSGFIKLYQFMNGQDAKDWDLYRMYGIHGSQANEYRKAKTLYSREAVENIFGIFLEYDLRSKGLHNVETEPEELLREMIFRILN